jgi:hypothetical protein
MAAAAQNMISPLPQPGPAATASGNQLVVRPQKTLHLWPTHTAQNNRSVFWRTLAFVFGLPGLARPNHRVR